MRLEKFPIPPNLSALYEEKDENKLEINYPELLEPLSVTNYCNKFHTLLYMMQIEENLILKKFNMDSAIMTRSKKYLCLQVNDLDKYPDILRPMDIVNVKYIYPGSQTHEGSIFEINGDKLFIKFSKLFHIEYNQRKVSIEFFKSPINYKYLHNAVDSAHLKLGQNILFPDSSRLKYVCVDSFPQPLMWYNSQLNQTQKTAIKKFINNASNLPYIIVGPPGTGKTSTLIEAILQTYVNPNSTIVVVTPSNSAANNILKLLLKSHIDKKDLIRLVSVSAAESEDLSEDLKQYCAFINTSKYSRPNNKSAFIDTSKTRNKSAFIDTSKTSNESAFIDTSKTRNKSAFIDTSKTSNESAFIDTSKTNNKSAYIDTSKTSNESALNKDDALLIDIQHLSPTKIISSFRIIASTFGSIAKFMKTDSLNGRITHLFIDEASQAIEPEIMVALSLIDRNYGKVCLAGDPKQLGPVIMSQMAKKYGAGESFLERILSTQLYKDNDCVVTTLVDNYRSLSKVIETPNKLFYDSALITHRDSEKEKIKSDLNILKNIMKNNNKPFDSDNFPGLFFHYIKGFNCKEDDSKSWLNRQEGIKVFNYTSQFYKKGFTPEDIGIITPYTAQVRFIENIFKSNECCPPKIGTVELFQGSEKKIMIISTVRSENSVKSEMSIQFVSCPKRVNVALTRAELITIILGDSNALSKNKLWCNIIENICNNNAYIKSYQPCNKNQKNAKNNLPVSSKTNKKRNTKKTTKKPFESYVFENSNIESSLAPNPEIHEKDVNNAYTESYLSRNKNQKNIKNNLPVNSKTNKKRNTKKTTKKPFESNVFENSNIESSLAPNPEIHEKDVNNAYTGSYLSRNKNQKNVKNNLPVSSKTNNTITTTKKPFESNVFENSKIESSEAGGSIHYEKDLLSLKYNNLRIIENALPRNPEVNVNNTYTPYLQNEALKRNLKKEPVQKKICTIF